MSKDNTVDFCFLEMTSSSGSTTRISMSFECSYSIIIAYTSALTTKHNSTGDAQSPTRRQFGGLLRDLKYTITINTPMSY
jgi:hypothetical protein